MKKLPVGILVLVLCLGVISAVQAAGPASTWAKLGSNPVIGRVGDGWDNAKVTSPSLIALAGNPYSYVAFYTGDDGSSERIGVATSPDAVNWTRYGGNPVLDTGVRDQDWDGYAVLAPSVVYDGNLFRMWYTGSAGGMDSLQLGLAESVDGTTWTKIGGAPVMGPGDFDFEMVSVGLASVISQDGVFKMWYSGYNNGQWAIGFATSPDGITWTKYGGNPVLSASGAGFDSYGAWMPSVIYKDGQYQMFYTGIDDNTKFRIGYATSTDAVNWTRSSSPIINLGPGGSFDENNAWTPSVVYSANRYYMLYTGVNSGDSNAIGLAISIPPSINGPVVAGDVTVRGLGMPGNAVSIISHPSGTTIGTGTVPSNGQFAITVTPLAASTSIEAVVGSDHSSQLTVFSTLLRDFLPAILRFNNQG